MRFGLAACCRRAQALLASFPPRRSRAAVLDPAVPTRLARRSAALPRFVSKHASGCQAIMAGEKPYTWKQVHEEVTIIFPIASAIKAKCVTAIAFCSRVKAQCRSCAVSASLWIRQSVVEATTLLGTVSAQPGRLERRTAPSSD